MSSSVNFCTDALTFWYFQIRIRLEEIEWAVKEGAKEIDIVITRAHVLQSNWKALYDEVSPVETLILSWPQLHMCAWP